MVPPSASRSRDLQGTQTLSRLFSFGNAEALPVHRPPASPAARRAGGKEEYNFLSLARLCLLRQPRGEDIERAISSFTLARARTTLSPVKRAPLACVWLVEKKAGKRFQARSRSDETRFRHGSVAKKVKEYLLLLLLLLLSVVRTKSGELRETPLKLEPCVLCLKI